VSEWQWQLAIPGGATMAWVVGLVLFALWLVEIRAMEGESLRRRAVLATLGGLGILGVYLLALQITLVRETFEEVAGGTVVLLDNSRSMSLADGQGTRRDGVTSLVESWQDDGRVTPLAYLFGASVRATPWEALPSNYDATDDATRLREAIDGALSNDVEGNVGSVVVVSDGADATFKADSIAIDEATPVVHSVVVGADSSLNDQAVLSLRADTTAYVGVPAMIRANVRAVGSLRLTELRVQLWHESRLEQETLAMLGTDGRGTVEFEVTPKRVGRALYRIVIPVAKSDEVSENNVRAALLRVGRERLRVLLVAGRPSWDVRFLRDFLKRDGSVDLISFFILRASSDLTAASTNELALIPFPTDELFREHLGSFDVVLFQNFDYAPYEMATYLPRIEEYVERGGSFAMIGGDRSFGEGRYAGTPIENILPVKIGGGGVVRGDIRAEVRKDLARHPIVALGPDVALTRKTWNRLPKLRGANRVTAVKPGAQVLLQHPRARVAGAPLPLLVVGESGRGRSAALMTDSSWRWRFAADEVTVGSDEYELFWDRMIRWLTRDPLLEPARISTDRERYGIGAEVEVSGRLRNELYDPIRRANAELYFEPSESSDPVATLRTDPDGRLRVRVPAPTEPGAYEVFAVVDGKELAREVFIVEEGSDELADLEAIPEELKKISEKTGGRVFLGVDDVPPLAELASTTRRAAGLVSKQPLSNPWFVFLTIAVLGATWVLRRRWGRR
jgi:uncharacterized membrane protein